MALLGVNLLDNNGKREDRANAFHKIREIN